MTVPSPRPVHSVRLEAIVTRLQDGTVTVVSRRRDHDTPPSGRPANDPAWVPVFQRMCDHARRECLRIERLVDERLHERAVAEALESVGGLFVEK